MLARSPFRRLLRVVSQPLLKWCESIVMVSWEGVAFQRLFRAAMDILMKRSASMARVSLRLILRSCLVCVRLVFRRLRCVVVPLLKSEFREYILD